MKKQNSVTILIVVLIIFIIINIYFIFSNFYIIKSIKLNQINESFSKEEFEIIKLSDSYNPLSLKDFTKVKFDLDKNLVMHLYNNCSSLDMPTNEFQAYSISSGIKGSIDIRPTMHDITKSLFNDLNITVLMSQVIEKREDLYIALMFVKKDDKITSIDIKPSDAVSMAIRTNTPVYVKNDLMKKYGNFTC